MPTMIFVNLPVTDLERSKSFYSALGFDINPQFTDDNAACVVISDTIFAMLVTKPYFETFSVEEHRRHVDERRGDQRAVDATARRTWMRSPTKR